MPCAMLLALTTQVAAQDLPVLGQGNLSCDSWAERRGGDASDAATMTVWMLGYITAYNQYAGPIQRLMCLKDSIPRSLPSGSTTTATRIRPIAFTVRPQLSFANSGKLPAPDREHRSYGVLSWRQKRKKNR